MFGVVLKANWSEEPVTVNQTSDTDNFKDEMPIDPNNVADTWPKDGIEIMREFRVRSTETGYLRGAYVVRQL